MTICSEMCVLAYRRIYRDLPFRNACDRRYPSKIDFRVQRHECCQLRICEFAIFEYLDHFSGHSLWWASSVSKRLEK